MVWVATHALKHWSVHFLANVIFITEWDPPAVGKCNLEGSPQSVLFSGFLSGKAGWVVGIHCGRICLVPLGENAKTPA